MSFFCQDVKRLNLTSSTPLNKIVSGTLFASIARPSTEAQVIWDARDTRGGEHVCISTSVVLWGHLDIHDSWTSLSLNLALFLFPLQGYDESYTDTTYESYDSYYSQPQAWVNQTSLWFSPASHKVHTHCLVASFTRKAIWVQQKYFLATLHKFKADSTSCFMVWM